MDNLRGLLTGLSTNDEFLLESCQKATAWGVSIVPDTTRPVQTRPVRIALTPRSFPATLFNKVVALNPIFNRLVDSIATDVEWLISAHHGMFRHSALPDMNYRCDTMRFIHGSTCGHGICSVFR